MHYYPRPSKQGRDVHFLGDGKKFGSLVDVTRRIPGMQMIAGTIHSC